MGFSVVSLFHPQNKKPWKRPITQLSRVLSLQSRLSADNYVKQSRVISRRLTHIQTRALVFNSETLISYFQLIIIISGSVVRAVRAAGRWGGGLRWRTGQMDDTVYGSQARKKVSGYCDGLDGCVQPAVCVRSGDWVSTDFFRLMRPFSCPDNK